MDVMAAFTANTCVAVTSDGKTGSAQIDDVDASYEAKVWEGVADCSDSPKKQVSVPKDVPAHQHGREDLHLLCGLGEVQPCWSCHWMPQKLVSSSVPSRAAELPCTTTATQPIRSLCKHSTKLRNTYFLRPTKSRRQGI